MDRTAARAERCYRFCRCSDMGSPGLLRNWYVLGQYPDFLKMFVGDTVSAVGSAISGIALPLAAVLLLHASSFEMGVLGAMGVIPHLVLGLPAGVWVERLSYRRWLVLADSSRALLFGAIPVLAAFDVLQIWHLYLVAVLSGVATLFDAVASTSFVPQLVDRDHLLAANSASTQSSAVVSVTGSSLGGALVQLLTAPVAIAVDACSFAVSAVISARIRRTGAAVASHDRDRRFWAHMWEGVRAVFASPILRALMLVAGLGALFGQMQNVVVVLYLVRGLNLPPILIGVVFTVSGIAALVGALLSAPITRRFGHGPTFMVGQLSVAIGGLALAAAGGPLLVTMGVLVAAQVFRGAGPPMYSVNQSTIRQTMTEAGLLARVNATWRFLVFGTQPLGALIGGVLGQLAGLRTTIFIGSLGMLAVTGLALRSPLRGLKTLPGIA